MSRSPTDDTDTARTSFGFRNIDTDAKPALVQAVFDSVAARYDLMNDLMSLGVHRLWKAALIDWLRPRPDMHLLDVAGGTGDVAMRFLAAGGRRVAVCDLTERMVGRGRDRALDRGVLTGVDWVVGDAESLPFADATFDAYTVAFGLRNVARLDAALAEARRVLRPGGRFLCLEFSHVAAPWLGVLYDRYSFSVLPALGAVVARDGGAYRYLVESIRRFPDQDRFATSIESAGLDRVAYRNLSGGVAALHSARRI